MDRKNVIMSDYLIIAFCTLAIIYNVAMGAYRAKCYTLPIQGEVISLEREYSEDSGNLIGYVPHFRILLDNEVINEDWRGGFIETPLAVGDVCTFYTDPN